MVVKKSQNSAAVNRSEEAVKYGGASGDALGVQWQGLGGGACSDILHDFLFLSSPLEMK